MKSCPSCGKEKAAESFYRITYRTGPQTGLKRLSSYCISCEKERVRIKRLTNKDRTAAHNAVQYALRNGTLKRKPCEVCGSEPAQAHHDDYDRKLDVRWLCQQHHKEEHSEMYARLHTFSRR